MQLRCKNCNDIIEGDQRGTYISCKCGKIAIDETKYYCRVIGNEEDIEEVVNSDKEIDSEDNNT